MSRESYYEDPYLQTYEKHLATAMHLRPVEEEAVAPVRRVSRVLLMPAFHAECCITVREEEHAARVELVAMTPRFWQAYYHQDKGTVPAGTPQRVAGTSEPISGPELEHFRDAIARSNVFDMLEPPGGSGMAGLPVRAWCVEAGGRSRAFNVWSPTRERTPEASAFVEAVYRLAERGLVGDAFQELLSGLEGYLDLES